MIKKKISTIVLISAVLLVLVCFSSVKVSAFDNASAKSAILIEASTGKILYAKNEHERRPMASTTKIMTALITLESQDLDEKFRVNNNAIKVEGSTMGLQENDIVTKRTLVYGMLLPSGNDAANAGAVSVAGSIKNFVKMMNERAKMLGLKDTSFETPSGLDGKNHYSTAYDMAMLGRAAISNPDFLKVCSTKVAKLEYGNPPYTRYITGHNRLLKEYKGAIGIKTGFTKKAGRCLVSAATRKGVTLIAVTLYDHSDWSDHKAMLDYGFKQVKTRKFTPDVSDIKIHVVGSKTKEMNVIPGDYPRVCLGIDDKKKLVRKVYTKDFLYAPVKSGDVIGYARYYLDGISVAEIPLLASNDAYEHITEIKVKFSDKLSMFFKNIWYSVSNFFDKLF